MVTCEAGRALAPLLQADLLQAAPLLQADLRALVGTCILSAALSVAALALALALLAALALAALAPCCEQVVVPSSVVLAQAALSAVYSQEAF